MKLFQPMNFKFPEKVKNEMSFNISDLKAKALEKIIVGRAE
jgi:hypothetical protein